MSDFPVVDISRFHRERGVKATVASDVDEVCRATGFLAVVGHGFPPETQRAAWDSLCRFFELPLEKKLEVAMPRMGYPYGYSPYEGEALARSLGDRTPPDLKESYSIGPPVSWVESESSDVTPWALAPTLWPAEPVELKASWCAYFNAMSELTARIMSIFAVALGLPEGFFADKIDRHASAVRGIHYPPLSQAPAPGQLRAGAHSDYGSVTILLPEEGSSGLEILRPDGAWQGVPAIPGAFIVNIGDLMARWTNDRWVSTVHRVICPPGSAANSRRSLAFFHLPNWDAEIACIPTCLAEGEVPKHPPVQAGQHLMEKFRRTVELERS